jgi:hypothetical protein
MQEAGVKMRHDDVAKLAGILAELARAVDRLGDRLAVIERRLPEAPRSQAESREFQP